MPAPNGPGRRRYVSAGELADYAFCPRSHYYRLHPEGRLPADGAREREAAGVEYHRRAIGSDRRWAGASPVPWVVAVAIGFALVAVVFLGWPF